MTELTPAVVATAGHVDHGKSTLVRALTGTDPDRWAEEQRRGLTLDLGFASCVLPSGRRVSLVDVPGHERYVGNALAGLGPVRVVLLCVAADAGWQQQTSEHLDALLALGIEHVVLVVTRSDLADPGPALAAAQSRLAAVAHVEIATSPGTDGVTAALERCLERVPRLDGDARVRLWVDRSFSVRGRGRVVTGTLEAGTVSVGDVLTAGDDEVRVRGLQVHSTEVTTATGPARVALAIRTSAEPGRGTPIVTPHRWYDTEVVDVLLTAALAPRPGQLVLHVGTAAVPVRVRPLGHRHARLHLPHPLPLTVGDRGALRDPGAHRVIAGAVVLDVAPPPLTRRGAAAVRAALLHSASPMEVALAPGPLRTADLVRRGIAAPAPGPDVVRCGDHTLLHPQLHALSVQLAQTVEGLPAASPGLPVDAAARRLGVDDDLVPHVAQSAGLTVTAGQVVNPRHGLDAAAESAVRELERRLTSNPWNAPDRGELRDLRLDARTLATAAARGRLLRLTPDLVLLPSAPAQAIAVLRGVRQPFAVGEAARALGTSRRVVVPLLEHLDGLGLTVRDGALRQTAGVSGS